jgi:hypothetical protein
MIEHRLRREMIKNHPATTFFEEACSKKADELLAQEQSSDRPDALTPRK